MTERNQKKGFSRIYPWTKRGFDLLFGLIGMILISPLLPPLMLLVKLTSKGPIFYGATRMGQGGNLFTLWKLRTMRVGAAEELDQLLENDPNLREEWERYYKLKKDPRWTPIGEWLRKTSLDEIPQLFNVLKGDLSLVGPRPVDIIEKGKAMEEFRAIFKERSDTILAAKPGAFSLWQHKGRNLLTFDQRVALEVEYLENQSLLFDFKITMKTLFSLLRPKGAY